VVIFNEVLVSTCFTSYLTLFFGIISIYIICTCSTFPILIKYVRANLRCLFNRVNAVWIWADLQAEKFHSRLTVRFGRCFL